MTKHLLLLCFIFCGCFGTSNLDTLYNRNLRMYDAENAVSLRILHQKGQSVLAMKVDKSDYDIWLRAYTGFDAQEPIFDKMYQVRGNAKDSIQVIALPTQAPLFALEVNLYPAQTTANAFYSNAVWVNRLQDNEQSIYTTNSSGVPLIRKYIKKGEMFKFAYRNDSISHFFLNYFSEPPSPAPPPHSTANPLFNPLSGWDKRMKAPIGEAIQLNEEGLYFVQSDSASNKGAFILCVDEDFPKLTRVNDLILSMRYITKNDEYDAMQKAEDKKKAMDEYWLGRNTDKEKARQQLKLYFKRIYAANEMFTAQTEGWKTDRGLIYCVFGKPDAIRKFSNKEVWRYEASGNRPEVEWLFNRTGEQYILERYTELKEAWSLEIQKWRTGVAN